MDKKLCMNCDYFASNDRVGPGAVARCSHDALKVTSLVNGGVYGPQCSDVRKDNKSLCGPSGKLWDDSKIRKAQQEAVERREREKPNLYYHMGRVDEHYGAPNHFERPFDYKNHQALREHKYEAQEYRRKTDNADLNKQVEEAFGYGEVEVLKGQEDDNTHWPWMIGIMMVGALLFFAVWQAGH